MTDDQDQDSTTSPLSQAPLVEVASEDGICFCPCCSAVVRVVPHHRKTPTVVDVDGRAHLCERHIAAALVRAGVQGMQQIVEEHGQRRPVAPPLRRTTKRRSTGELTDVE